jgi:class 3 adenylate cyclase
VRKTVTVVFCDVTGSTELGESTDPEAVRGLLARCIERMRGIVEAQGGSAEKFIGDAVMAVFGMPVSHEDDAPRACRAAGDLRAAFPKLGIAGRIGVNTGEVVTGTEERLATGDAVNVAARLEQVAQPGEVLLGAETLALAGSAVEVGEERDAGAEGQERAGRRVSARRRPRSGSRPSPGRAVSSSRLSATPASGSRGWSVRRSAERARSETLATLDSFIGDPARARRPDAAGRAARDARPDRRGMGIRDPCRREDA